MAIVFYTLGGAAHVLDDQYGSHEPLERFATAIKLKRKDIKNGFHPVLAEIVVSKAGVIDRIQRAGARLISQPEAFQIVERKKVAYEMRRKEQ